MSFKKAVEAIGAPVKSAYEPGKRALPKLHAKKISCAADQRIHGSIFLDDALKGVKKHSQASRWDYGLGYTNPAGKEFAIWVEVHTASTDEVRTVIRKMDWLRDYLDSEAPALRKLTPALNGNPDPFVWIASNGNHILKNSPQARLLAQSGLRGPINGLVLP